MTIQAMSTIKPQQKKSNNYPMALALGAAIGGSARYILPNKNAKVLTQDSFFSAAKMNARSADRSLLKYASIGALIGAGINALIKTFSSTNSEEKDEEQITYSKYGILLDAPDYTCEIAWQNEDLEE